MGPHHLLRTHLALPHPLPGFSTQVKEEKEGGGEQVELLLLLRLIEFVTDKQVEATSRSSTSSVDWVSP